MTSHFGNMGQQVSNPATPYHKVRLYPCIQCLSAMIPFLGKLFHPLFLCWVSACTERQQTRSVSLDDGSRRRVITMCAHSDRCLGVLTLPVVLYRGAKSRPTLWVGHGMEAPIQIALLPARLANNAKLFYPNFASAYSRVHNRHCVEVWAFACLLSRIA